MIGGDERGGCAYKVRLEEHERRLVVAVVEGDHGEQAGEGSRNAQRMARAEGLEGVAKQMRGETAGPLVEIADHEARRGEVRAGEDLFTEQNAGLAATLVEAGAEVNVEDVQELAIVFDVGLQCATLFAA